ncbi:protein kinase family protein / WD-40 repeat family protein [Zea mays]|uniref:Protein kinase family protein / WD-40 repeat family protein n=1 Tax=Zea mays TaxID=4577 RepID=A0A1D6K2Z0_MAIZE|nr:protein kinase family protein / WD-40 repeat family protein [Zea mays]ONL98030.1 protein kinase family protein / WD-40 repeat family protein [Zea mays]
MVLAQARRHPWPQFPRCCQLWLPRRRQLWLAGLRARWRWHITSKTYNLVLLDVDSHDRFLKSVCCKHDEVLLIIKVYFKRTGAEWRLERIRNTFKGIEGSHMWPFQMRILCLGLTVLILILGCRL